jgi:fumarate hydratase subunit beta
MENGRVELKVPLKEKDVRQLKLGDIIYLTGRIFSATQSFYIRVIDDGEDPPFNPKECNVLFHVPPTVRRVGNTWEISSLTPTTSAVFERWMPFAIKRLGIRAVIGKGPLKEKTAEVMKFGAVYLTGVGGWAGVLYASKVKFQNVYWLELGIPQATWIFKAENLGPLLVTIDAHGNNLYEEVNSKLEKKIRKIYNSLGILYDKKLN